MESQKPAFDIINIYPGFLVGRCDLATDVETSLQSTNGLALTQLLGIKYPFNPWSSSTDVKDVALAHVLCLNPSIGENQDFLISSDGPQGATWGDAVDIVSMSYPEHIIKAAGFKLDGGRIQTVNLLLDSTYSQNTLGIKLKLFKEQVITAVDNYLEILGAKEG